MSYAFETLNSLKKSTASNCGGLCSNDKKETKKIISKILK
jgi:hypothetical protein